MPEFDDTSLSLRPRQLRESLVLLGGVFLFIVRLRVVVVFVAVKALDILVIIAALGIMLVVTRTNHQKLPALVPVPLARGPLLVNQCELGLKLFTPDYPS